MPTQVDDPSVGASRCCWSPARSSASVSPGDGRAIDGVHVDGGRALAPADAGRPAAVLEASFAALPRPPRAGDVCASAGGRRSAVCRAGHVAGVLLRHASGRRRVRRRRGELRGRLHLAADCAATPAARHGAVNDARPAISRPGADRGDGRPTSSSGALAARAASAGTVTHARRTRPLTAILYKDAEGDQQLFNIFAVLILAGAALATFNLATRIVEAQRREIGIGMALGVPPRELAIRPLLLGVQIARRRTSCSASVLGSALGETCSAGVLEDLLPLPGHADAVRVRRLRPRRGARAACCRSPRPRSRSGAVCGVTPIEAIRVGFRAAKRRRLAALWQPPARCRARALAQMPLRNVLRAPRRTLMTVARHRRGGHRRRRVPRHVDSFRRTVDRSETEVSQTTPDRIDVSLERFESENGVAVRAVERADGVATVQPSLDLPVRLESSEDVVRRLGHAARFRRAGLAPDGQRGRRPRPGRERDRDRRGGRPRPRRRDRRPGHARPPRARPRRRLRRGLDPEWRSRGCTRTRSGSSRTLTAPPRRRSGLTGLDQPPRGRTPARSDGGSARPRALRRPRHRRRSSEPWRRRTSSATASTTSSA